MLGLPEALALPEEAALALSEDLPVDGASSAARLQPRRPAVPPEAAGLPVAGLPAAGLAASELAGLPGAGRPPSVVRVSSECRPSVV